MQEVERDRLLAQAEELFLEGMKYGYASGAKAVPLAEDADWKVFEYRALKWYLQDRYYVDPVTGKSVGETRIYFGLRLLWWMNYGGFYPKRAVPCLKAALMENYRAGVFHAGRGKHMYRHGDGSYEISVVGNFERFTAREKVQCLTPREGRTPMYEPAGEHRIWGMALI